MPSSHDELEESSLVWLGDMVVCRHHIKYCADRFILDKGRAILTLWQVSVTLNIYNDDY